MNFLVETAISRGRDAGVQREAYDGMARISEDDPLGLCLGPAVNCQWIDGIGLGVVTLGPVEHEVRGKENQGYVPGEVAQFFGEFDVYFARQLGLFFTSGRFAERSAMDQQIGRVILQQSAKTSLVYGLNRPVPRYCSHQMTSDQPSRPGNANPSAHSFRFIAKWWQVMSMPTAR